MCILVACSSVLCVNVKVASMKISIRRVCKNILEDKIRTIIILGCLFAKREQFFILKYISILMSCVHIKETVI